jgi:hypothetical protein
LRSEAANLLVSCSVLPASSNHADAHSLNCCHACFELYEVPAGIINLGRVSIRCSYDLQYVWPMPLPASDAAFTLTQLDGGTHYMLHFTRTGEPIISGGLKGMYNVTVY